MSQKRTHKCEWILVIVKEKQLHVTDQWSWNAFSEWGGVCEIWLRWGEGCEWDGRIDTWDKGESSKSRYIVSKWEMGIEEINAVEEQEC